METHSRSFSVHRVCVPRHFRPLWKTYFAKISLASPACPTSDSSILSLTRSLSSTSSRSGKTIWKTWYFHVMPFTWRFLRDFHKSNFRATGKLRLLSESTVRLWTIGVWHAIVPSLARVTSVFAERDSQRENERAFCVRRCVQANKRLSNEQKAPSEYTKKF